MPDEIFPPAYYHRADESDDRNFYLMPRMVAHIDENAIAATVELYRDILPPDSDVLDLMSSRYSHLPEPRNHSVPARRWVGNEHGRTDGEPATGRDRRP